MRSSNAKRLARYTVKIDTETKKGPNPGTGFFIRLRIEGSRAQTYLVTNKHIVEGCTEFAIYLSQVERKKRSQVCRTIYLPRDGEQWKMHPEDAVDLAALPVDAILKEAEREYGRSFDRPAFSEAMIATDKEVERVGPAAEVLVVGYPNGVWDTTNNYPLFSKGVTATSPNIAFVGKPAFLIDASCFPGSSGSPVFSLASLESKAFRPKLLGVLYSGTTTVVPIHGLKDAGSPKIRLPTNFAYVVRSSKLLDFCRN